MAGNRWNILNSIPALGHIKGTIQHIFGDQEAAAEAFRKANRTTTVLAAGAAGFYLAGVPLAILFSTAVGAEWDLGSIYATHGKCIEGICHIIDDPSNLNAWIDATVDVANDGLTGLVGGRMAETAGNATPASVMATVTAVTKTSNTG